MGRYFFAIPLDDFGSDLTKIQGDFNSFYLKLVNSFHLTLDYLGELNESDVIYYSKRLKSFKFDSFDVNISKIGLFPKLSDPKVIWTFSNDVTDIKNVINLSNMLKKHSIRSINSSYVPHVTLARIKELESKKKFVDMITNYKFEKFSIKINKIVFYKSNNLTSLECKYEEISSVNAFSKDNL